MPSRTRFDPAHRRLELDFDSRAELDAYLETARDRGRVFLRLDESPGTLREIKLIVRFRDAETELRGEVEQVFRSGTTGHGVALRIVERDPRYPTDAPQSEQRRRQLGEAEGLSEPSPGSPGALSEIPLAVAIQRMNVTQRLLLATRAGRTERQILLRDSSPQVLMALLSNSRIQEQEVLELVRSPHAASGVLQQVAKDRKWSSNYEIRKAVIRNPKTPVPLAQRLLPTLRQQDLQALAKSSDVREAIKGAALRLYLGKM